METIHYTEGYGGKLNYKTICGKEIHSHDEKDKATIHPDKVNCKECKKSDKWEEDYNALSDFNPNIKRRVYLESDVLSASELRSAQREVYDLCKEKNEKCVKRVFNEVLDYAWHDLDKTWNAVKNANEIYSDSSLMPIVGNAYMGAPVIFNGMCKRAIEENVTGKSVVILNKLTSIYWGMIDIQLMKMAFKNNKLFMYDDNMDLVEVNVSKIKK